MENNIAFLCMDVSRLLRKQLDEAAKKVGATGAQWRTLLVLRQLPGLTQGAMAEYMDVEPMTICRMVDRLEQAGFVERRRDPADRRAWQLFLTDAAKPVVEELQQIGLSMVDRSIRDLSQDQIEQLRTSLNHIRGNLLNMDGPAELLEVKNG